MSKVIDLGSSIDQILENFPIGDVGRAISDNLYGFNTVTKNSPIPRSRDSYGYTFFTRPQLNLTDINVFNNRKFHGLLARNPMSYGRYVRMMLDPRLGHNGMKSPLVNNNNAFIPLLTNTIEDLSGFPDMALPTSTSETGLYGQQQTVGDGTPNHFEEFDITCSFKPIQGNVTLYLFMIWIYYISLVSVDGSMSPYLGMIYEKEIDYNTRVYRLVMDQSNTYVRELLATGASFPVNLPMGARGDFSSERPYMDTGSSISIQFKSNGYLFGDDYYKLEFNRTQAIFNTGIAEILRFDNTSRNREAIHRANPKRIYYIEGGSLVKIPTVFATANESNFSFNPFYSLRYHLIPYINLFTNELEWWCDRAVFDRLLGKVL